MEKDRNLDELAAKLPGDKTLRLRRRKSHERLRITPNFPGIIRFIRDMALGTPLIPLILTLVVLWLLFSLVIYLAEREVNEQLITYGHTLWWSFTAMQTQGANAPGPITTSGIVLGAVWSIFSTIAFFGVIIGSFYAYYMLPRRQHTREILNAIQYNLEEFEKLSVDELEALKEVTERTINTQLNRVREKDSD